MVDRLREDLQERDQRILELEAENERLRRLEEFLSHISHEMRTPLTSILGFSKILQDGLAGELTPQQQEYQEIIHKQGLDLLRFTNDLLDFLKMRSTGLEVHPVEIAVEMVVADCMAAVMPLANNKGLCLRFSTAPDLPEAYADPQRLHQVLLNLLSNAIKFTPAGGTVELKVLRHGAEDVEITVADTGVGIPADQIEQIFDRFHQVDGWAHAAKGTGLGLAIAKHLVEKHDGRIWVESDPGAGTTFHFTLPAIC